MNDADFSALERRLAPVPAAGSSREYRREVEALLAECRALRSFAAPALGALEHVSWVFETLDSLRAEAGPDERLAAKLRHHLATARGHLLAALAARPPGAGADHDAGDRQLDRLLRDGAELERLRLPPDVAGLMTPAALENLHRYVSSEEGDWLSPAVNHIDAQAALIRELYGVVADLHADDPGRQALLERGRAEGREQALGVLREHRGVWQHRSTDERLKAGPVRGLDGLEEKLKALGPCRPPPPPHAAEAEAGRLREALRAVVDGKDASDAAFCLAAEEARKVLAEGDAP